jgi:hypothetical protein
VCTGGGMAGRLLRLKPPWSPGEVVPDLLAVALTSLRGTSSLGGEDTGMGAVNTMPTPVPYKVGPVGNTVPLGFEGEGMPCVVTGALAGGAVLTGRLGGAAKDNEPAIGALYTTPVGVPYKIIPAEAVPGTNCCCTVVAGLIDAMGACMMGVAVVHVGTVVDGMMVPTSGANDGGARITGMDGSGMLMGIEDIALGTVTVVGMTVVALVALMLVETGVWINAAVVTKEATETAATVVLIDAVA